MMPGQDNEAYWVARHEEYRHKLAAVGDIQSSEERNLELYARKKRRVAELLRDTETLDLRGLSVLDAGCGIGILSELFYVLGAEEVNGVDASPVAVEEAALRCPGGLFTAGSLLDFSLEREFDLVFCLDVLYHVVDDENWKAALGRLVHHLKPGGRVYVIDQHKPEPFSPADHVRFRTREMYDEAMGALGARAVPLPDHPHFLGYERQGG